MVCGVCCPCSTHDTEHAHRTRNQRTRHTMCTCGCRIPSALTSLLSPLPLLCHVPSPSFLHSSLLNRFVFAVSHALLPPLFSCLEVVCCVLCTFRCGAGVGVGSRAEWCVWRCVGESGDWRRNTGDGRGRATSQTRFFEPEGSEHITIIEFLVRFHASENHDFTSTVTNISLTPLSYDTERAPADDPSDTFDERRDGDEHIRDEF